VIISTRPSIVHFLGLAAACVSLARGDVTVPTFFSDHAVLQKADKVPVWGKAAPGESVTVNLDKATATVKAGDDGKWKAILDLHTEGPGPYDLSIQGANQLTFKDVLVGEVWLCGGQSNMEFPLGAFPVGKIEVPTSANPLLRRFKVKFNASPTPVEDVQGRWELAGPKTTSQWTAVGYFFGKKIQAEMGSPVGLMEDCVGGTLIETWMSADALASDPDLRGGALKSQNDRLAFDNYGIQYAAWEKQYNREDHPVGNPQTFAAPTADMTGWTSVTIPGLLGDAGVPNGGAIWIRRTIPVPSDPDVQPNKGLDMTLGDIHDSADVYWEGKKIATCDPTATTHRVGVRFNLVQAPGGVLALRIFCPGPGAALQIGTSAGSNKLQANHFQLSGEWQAKVETALPAVDPAALATLPQKPDAVPYPPQNVAGYLWNGMINPVVSYGIRGVIWYQGEGNWNHGYQYHSEFPELIKDWRDKWGEGDFPFYFCQIANCQVPATKPGNDDAAELREGQDRGLSQPNTGEAILIDIGEEGNIHPADKPDVGDRLARLALANTYGKKDVVSAGPTFDSFAIEGDKVRVHFKHTDGGLIAKPMPATYQPLSTDPATKPLVRNSPDSQLEGFAICGEDRKWSWANATIDGDSVVVSSPDVSKPTAVRYAWAYYPWVNLYNGAGLPAGPFRTDDFPLRSEKSRYGDPEH
jgi:sialate O-acetylesterase